MRFLHAHRLPIALFFPVLALVIAWAIAISQTELGALIAVLTIGGGVLAGLGASLRLLAHRDKPMPDVFRSDAVQQPSVSGEPTASVGDAATEHRVAVDASSASTLDFLGKSFALSASVWAITVGVFTLIFTLSK